MNGQPAKDIPVEIDAQTNDGTAVHERLAAGQVGGDKTNELGHGRFVVDIPKTFTITHLVIKVCIAASLHLYIMILVMARNERYLFEGAF